MINEGFYPRLALDPKYVERCLKWIGEDEPDGEMFLRDLWEGT